MAAAEDMAERAFIRLGHRSENQAVLFLYVNMSWSCHGWLRDVILTERTAASPGQARQLFDHIS
jgi:hypothetical protein